MSTTMDTSDDDIFNRALMESTIERFNQTQNISSSEFSPMQRSNVSINNSSIQHSYASINSSPFQHSIVSINNSPIQHSIASINRSPIQPSIQNIMTKSPTAAHTTEARTELDRQLSNYSSSKNYVRSSQSTLTNISKPARPRRPPLRKHNLIPYETRFPRIDRYKSREHPQSFTCIDVLWKILLGPKRRTKA
uniref:Uncharacterized protein n=1 Tax=Panagrolaimus sp. PS1159 TaxID=55785 RepID=A0AC35EXJ5_9BILA